MYIFNPLLAIYEIDPIFLKHIREIYIISTALGCIWLREVYFMKKTQAHSEKI